MGSAQVKFCNNEDVSKTLKDESVEEVTGEVLATDLSGVADTSPIDEVTDALKSGEKETSELANGMQVEEASTTTPPSDDKAAVGPKSLELATQESDGPNQTVANQTEEVKDSKDEVQTNVNAKNAPKKRAVRPPVRCRVWCGSKGRVLEDSDDDRTDREKQDPSKMQEQPPQAPLDESKDDEKNAPNAPEGIKSDEASK